MFLCSHLSKSKAQSTFDVISHFLVLNIQSSWPIKYICFLFNPPDTKKFYFDTRSNLHRMEEDLCHEYLSSEFLETVVQIFRRCGIFSYLQSLKEVSVNICFKQAAFEAAVARRIERVIQ